MPDEYPEMEDFKQKVDQWFASLKRITVSGVNWAALQKARNAKVKKEDIDQMIKDAQGYPEETDSCIYLSEDGVFLAIFIKDAFFKCFAERLAADLNDKMVSVIEDLIQQYTPPPQEGDRRHKQRVQQGNPYGVVSLRT